MVNPYFLLFLLMLLGDPYECTTLSVVNLLSKVTACCSSRKNMASFHLEKQEMKLLKMLAELYTRDYCNLTEFDKKMLLICSFNRHMNNIIVEGDTSVMLFSRSCENDKLILLRKSDAKCTNILNFDQI